MSEPAAPGPRGGWAAAIEWTLQRRPLVLLVVGMLLAAGLYVAPLSVLPQDWPRDPVAVDAIPDLGDNQQIVFTEWPGRSPRDIEDQITYPLTSALLGIPGVRTIRSSSAFGFSTIYVVFDDDVEFYWSRSRLLEKLSALPAQTLPDGVRPTLGPDATALGQVFWYTLQGQDAAGHVVGGFDADELRSIQDFTVRYALQSVDGVSEVASVGGFVREYQVDVDPEAMRAHGVTLSQVAAAVGNSNLDVGARTLEVNGVEYVVRGLGYVQDLGDLEAAVVQAREHTPIRIRDVARVTLGPALRRGALDDAGAPAVGGVVVARFRENPRAVIEAVKARIAAIEPGLPRRTLADGTVSHVRIVPFYDRAQLIDATVDTLTTALYQQLLITALVVLVLLRQVRGALLVTGMLPLGVLLALILMKLFGVDANIMALAGIAVAIGTMVDIGIVFVDAIAARLGADSSGGRAARVRDAVAEVAPAVLTSVLTTVLSFLPVLGLSAAQLRLFAPLALTKTFAMVGALALSLVSLPTLAVLLWGRPSGTDRRPRLRFAALRRDGFGWFCAVLGAVLWWRALPQAAMAFALLGGYLLLRRHLPARVVAWRRPLELAVPALLLLLTLTHHYRPLGEGTGLGRNALVVGLLLGVVLGTIVAFEQVYPRLLGWVLRHRRPLAALPLLLLLAGVMAAWGAPRVLPRPLADSAVGRALSRLWPGLGREYMPALDEGAFLYMPTTMPHASMGEALRMVSDLDAAIAAIPEVERAVGKVGRVDSALDPAPVSMIETLVTYRPEFITTPDGRRVRQWRDHIRSAGDIWDEITRVAQHPGLTSAPRLMPIGARRVMLQSGMRSPLGIKVHGPDLESIEDFGLALEAALRQVPALRPQSVYAERVAGKPYLEIELDREAIARFGLSVVQVQEVLEVALGGATLTRTVEGRKRYPVRVRYMREDRDSMEALERIFVPTDRGQQIPLGQLASLRYARGPQVLRAEDTFPTSYVLFDKRPDWAEVDAVAAAQSHLMHLIESGELRVPEGVVFEFAGTYQEQLRAEQRLRLLVPLSLCCVFVVLYLQFRRIPVVAIVFSGVLVAASGGMLLLWAYGQPWFLDAQLYGVALRPLLGVGPVHLSVAVWIGFIALVGLATDDGVVMSTLLQQRFAAQPPADADAARRLTLATARRRVRACLMTTATTLLSLLPVIGAQGRGGDVMAKLALPMFGGMVFELFTLFVVPVAYCAWQEARLSSGAQSSLESEGIH